MGFGSGYPIRLSIKNYLNPKNYLNLNPKNYPNPFIRIPIRSEYGADSDRIGNIDGIYKVWTSTYYGYLFPLISKHNYKNVNHTRFIYRFDKLISIKTVWDCIFGLEYCIIVWQWTWFQNRWRSVCVVCVNNCLTLDF